VFTQGESGPEDRILTLPRNGEVIAILDAGAYGMSLSSQYNLRPRPAEVLVGPNPVRLIRRRESYQDLLRNFEGL
jgi:diaminopimelate decarboxylase